MPHQLSLRGSGELSTALRGLIKANLIHHLAHTAGPETLKTIGRAYRPPKDWLGPRGNAPEGLLELCLVPTGKLTPEHPGFAALSGQPDNPWAWVGLGLNYLRIWSGEGYFVKARDCFSEALRRSPRWAWGYLLRGEAERSLLNYKAALADYDRAIALDRGFAWAYAFKARVLFQAGTRVRDLKLMDRAIALEPKAGWMRAWRAEGYRRLGRFAEAEQDFQDALKLDPLYDQAYGWRAKLLSAQERHDEAISSLKKGIELCPDFEKAYRQLVRALRGAGRIEEALSVLNRAAALNHRNNWLGNWRVEGAAPDDEALAQLSGLTSAWAAAWRGETLCQLGMLEEALPLLTRAAEGGIAWAWAWRGECLLRMGREALPDLDRAVAADPSYGRAFVWRGRAKALKGDWAGAVADFDASMASRRVEYAWINAWRGQAKLMLGRVAEGIKDLDEALLLDPNCRTFQEWRAKPWLDARLAEEMRRSGAFGRAKGLLSALDARGNPWLYLLRYRLKCEAGYPGAFRDVDLAFRADPSCAWVFGLGPAPAQGRDLQDLSFARHPACGAVYAYRGQDRLRRGLREDGLADLELAAKLEPCGWILAWLGEAERKGDPAKAAAHLTEAIRADPRYANAYSWRGTARLQAGDAAGAKEDLDRAIRMRPTARAYKDRARALWALGDRRKALADFNRAVSLNGELSWDLGDAARHRREDPWFLAWAGEALVRQGKRSEAAKNLESALKRNPRMAWAWTWLAEAKPEGAIRHLERARKLDPHYQRTYEALAGLSEPKEAAALLSRAIRLNPYSARLYRRRAQAWEAVGRAAKAQADREQAERLCPEPLKALEFFVNYACNAKCPFCFNPPDASPELEKGLPFSDLSRRLYAGYQRGYRAVKFIGGEVTVRDDLPKILALARKIGYQSIQITTNGIRLADPGYARRLFDLGADTFRFSIHGHTPALHDRLVAVPGALEKIEKAVETLRPLGAKLGINYVLNRLNFEDFPETMEYFHKRLGIDDVIVYFLRFQGFGALPENRDLLKLRMSEAAPKVREAFARLKSEGISRMPALIHFPPCAMPELSAHMLDWTNDKDEDLVTSPAGDTAPIREVTNSGKKPVAACASCVHSSRCLGVEENYVALFGESEFHAVPA